MIYDMLPVALLTALAAGGHGDTNAQIARYVIAHAVTLPDLSVKELASACHVGTGTISRFAREMGFAGFAELREAFLASDLWLQRAEGKTAQERSLDLVKSIGSSLARACRSIDHAALARLVDDLERYERVSAYGLLKAQTAALDLQVDLLALGKYVDTRTAFAEQRSRIAQAGADELVIVFSYTGSYFDGAGLEEDLRRLDRPRIWMVAGKHRELPPFVADCLLFDSELDQFGHPYQLQYVAGLIAQEYAARL